MPEFSLARTFRNRGLLLQTGSQFSRSVFSYFSLTGKLIVLHSFQFCNNFLSYLDKSVVIVINVTLKMRK